MRIAEEAAAAQAVRHAWWGQEVGRGSVKHETKNAQHVVQGFEPQL